MNKLLEKLLIVYKPVDPCFTIANNASSFLKSQDVEVYAVTIDDLSPQVAERILESGFDAMLSIGGDGTFIRVSKLFSNYLVIPYPCGRRNTFYELGLASIDQVLNLVLRGQFYIEFIPIHKICQLDRCFEFINDAVLISSDLGKANRYSVKARTHCISNEVLFEGDGLIVSTTYGSSGHNLSAGGPLVAPMINALVITPINPIQLNIPSFVVSTFSSVEISVGNNSVLYIDGDRAGEFGRNTVFTVHHGLRYAKVARFLPLRNTWRNILDRRGRIY